MKKRILVFPCGSEIGLEIYRSLRFSKDFELYGASSVHDHGEYTYENYIEKIPFVDDDGFIRSINDVVQKYEIDFIFPAHDSVVLKLAQNQEGIDAKIMTSPQRTCEIARSKHQTYETLKNIVAVPKIYSPNDSLQFPVFLKPDVGQGSRGVLKANSQQEVKSALSRDESLLVLEYLPGEEYTIDCFTNKDGKLLFAQARERTRVTNGISVNSKVNKDSEFRRIATEINKSLEFRGVWFFQLKRNASGELTLLEVSPRVAGTMALCRMQGVNLPLLSLYDAQGVEVSILKNEFNVEIDRALTAKYRLNIEYSKVFVDFDDTIVLEDRANYLIIGLLYKFLTDGKKLVLITKHIKEIRNTLKEHKISEDIFEEIISLAKDDKKSDYITKDAIFIDDSFAERKVIYEQLYIPVFDVSEAVELL